VLQLQPVTNSAAIDLGGADGAGKLGLDATDLGNLIAGTVAIGGTANTGGITVSAAVTSPATTLALRNSGAITDDAAGKLIASQLVVLGGAITLDSGLHQVGKLAATGSNVTFANAIALAVDTVGATNGVTATTGAVRC
jgi:hypothetical protein